MEAGVIDALRAREDRETGCHRHGAPQLLPGTRVSIDTGPFAGFEGIFEGKTGEDRVGILLDLLRQRARTVVAAGEIGV